ncbi:MAG: hypothetical protein HKM24_05020 [Gammaproteobacteria bacterium]|nr:hypothetical protein [Gammaproteobacteria bacterium]
MAKQKDQEHEQVDVDDEVENLESAGADVVAISDEDVATMPDTNEPTENVEHDQPASGGKKSFVRKAFWWLLVLLLVAAGIWWLQNARDNGAASDSAIATSPSSRSSQQVSSLEKSQQQWSDRIDGLERQLTEQNLAVAARVGTLESAVAQSRGVSVSAQQIWQRAEAEYLLQVANHQVTIVKDIDSATAALRAADRRIQSLGDPGFVSTRAQIAEALATLGAYPRVDVEGISLELMSVERRVADMKLSSDYPANYNVAADATTDPAENDKALTRAWQAFSRSLTDIVRIRKTSISAQPLIIPQEAFFLRRNLELQLVAARVALLQGDGVNFNTAIKNSSTWLANYFDGSDATVVQAKMIIDQLTDVDINRAMPDISHTLRVFRRTVANIENQIDTSPSEVLPSK